MPNVINKATNSIPPDESKLRHTKIADFSFAKWEEVSQYYPGIMVCVFTAIAAQTLASNYQAPVMLFALLMGLSTHFLYHVDQFRPGLEFCARNLLRIGVAFLGVRIATADILSLGLKTPVLVAGALVTTIVFGVCMARCLGLSRNLGILSGASVAICGVSAAAAVSSVLPERKSADKEFVLTVVSVTTLSTLAMILYPILIEALGLSDTEAGIFLGGSIHDVAQVVGAGFSISPDAGNIATYVKLLRVALLLPVVVVIFCLISRCQDSRHRGEQQLARPKSFTAYVPGFLIGFFALALIKNLGWIPASIDSAIQSTSSWCLVVSIAAIGIKTSLKDVYDVGWKPVFLVVSETALIAALVLAGVFYWL